MNKDLLIEMLERFINAEKMLTNYAVEAVQMKNANVLKAMDLLAELNGWKTNHNYCHKAPRPKGLGPL